ncbi:ArsR/SmtB family transcription factor [Microbacterium invictum]|uniref:DNA-binding transcriptional ArsR family regulator n=1 Tax=Microbacterium invictum TaxID=515415 RepID=A0AA40SLS5_9MICO|nr:MULTISPECIES: winged helix-turn-helix domain-containing protein [Microbacterium]MBB4138563.1 DNA-binding transcriptional ArsR family regulator [Microbacterium invictum]
MAEQVSRQVSDPARLRALAHPLRIRLFDLLNDHDELTASECAELVGQSPASCSFHLRMLEKYGFIERAQARGREKPWRLSAPSWDMRPEPGQRASLTTVAEIALLGLDLDVSRIRSYFEHVGTEPDEWVQASTFTRSTFWATADELAGLSRDLQRITDRFAGRQKDPSLRPEGARYARMTAITHPDPVGYVDHTTTEPEDLT